MVSNVEYCLWKSYSNYFDPNLVDLVILPTKTFGSKEIDRLATAIGR